MKIVAISDTHGCHRQLQLPQGDILIHAGDISNRGNIGHVYDFIDWYQSLDYPYKIFIQGNHDRDRTSNENIIPRNLPDSIIYLENEGIEINGYHIFGVPYQEEHEDIDYDWIPDETDILITHNPPYYIHDKAPNGLHRGSEALRNKVREVNPQVHVFGHIHVGYGSSFISPTQYINPSNYQALLDMIKRKPFVYDLERKLLLECNW